MHEKDRHKIPLFKSWGGWYAFVILFLLALIVLFSLFTKEFS